MSARFPAGRAAASALRMRHSFVKERFGEEGVERYEAAASPGLRAFLSMPDPADGWVDFRLFVEGNTLLETLFGTGDFSIVRAAGRYAAKHNSGVWQSLFEKGVDAPKFVEIAGGLWHKHYDVGKLTRTIVSVNEAHVEIQGLPMPHRAHCVSVLGWLEGVFEFKPGTHISIRELGCRANGDPSCEFVLVWS